MLARKPHKINHLRSFVLSKIEVFSGFWAQKSSFLPILDIFGNVNPHPRFEPIPLQNRDHTIGKCFQNTTKVSGLGPDQLIVLLDL